MSKIMELLAEKDAVVVFDIDGVLAPYEYGEYNHNACRDEEWDDYIQNHNVYGNVRPLKVFQEFINNKDMDRVFACSVANEIELTSKKEFVSVNYGIPETQIIFIKNKKEKIDVMREIHKSRFPELEPKKLIIVEDTTATLTQIQEDSEYSTAHVSSFLV